MYVYLDTNTSRNAEFNIKIDVFFINFSKKKTIGILIEFIPYFLLTVCKLSFVVTIRYWISTFSQLFKLLMPVFPLGFFPFLPPVFTAGNFKQITDYIHFNKSIYKYKIVRK